MIDWEDFDRLSAAVPLIARVYPNGSADVNAFEAAGGMPYVIRELLGEGLLHGDIMTIGGQDLSAYAKTAVVADGALDANLQENLYEVLNICSALYNVDGAAHMKLHQVLHVGADVAPQVQALFQKYGLTYTTGSLPRQVASAWKKVIRLSLPNDFGRKARAKVLPMLPATPRTESSSARAA